MNTESWPTEIRYRLFCLRIMRNTRKPADQTSFHLTKIPAFKKCSWKSKVYQYFEITPFIRYLKDTVPQSVKFISLFAVAIHSTYTMILDTPFNEIYLKILRPLSIFESNKSFRTVPLNVLFTQGYLLKYLSKLSGYSRLRVLHNIS